MIYLHIYHSYDNIKKSSKSILLANLATYLNKEISEIELHYNENGKPEVQGINFSISHSKKMMIQAFTENGDIGIDIEYLSDTRKYLRVAKRYFHTCEYKFLHSLDEKLRIKYFYDLWTTKEAVCKARGGRLWYYLSENYLEYNNKQKNRKMTTFIKGLHIKQFDILDKYSLSMVTVCQPKGVKYIHEY
jgi:4'-phosphopantetheinyl transferase